MIRSETVGLIEKLLGEGRLSHRQIAARAEVSRFTVRKIARGERPRHRPGAHEEDADSPLPVDGPLERPVGRCHQCGGLVQMPCRACHVRRLMGEGRLPPLESRRRRPR